MVPPAPPGVRQVSRVAAITVVNDLSELRRMSLWLAEAARGFGMLPERIFELDICANEVVTNIVSYAYAEPGQREIALCMEHAGAGVRLTIEDDGLPFNPLAAALAPAPASLAEAPRGGLGIKLIRGMMDDCEYTRQDGKNIFTIAARA